MKRCTKCNIAKPLDSFFRDIRSKDGHRTVCKECETASNQAWKAANREKYLAKKKRYACSRVETDKQYHRRRGLLVKFGLTLEQYNAMFEKQDGSCAICHRHQSEFKTALHVDHNHQTGTVRGLLCSRCNQAIGLLLENEANFKSAITYLKNHSNN